MTSTSHDQTKQDRANARNAAGTHTLDPLPRSLARLPEREFGYDQARHLLLRAGFGGTPDQIQTLATWGLEKSVDYVVDVDEVPFDAQAEEAFDRNIMRPPTPDEQAEYRAARRSRDEDVLARFRLQRQNAQRADRGQIQRMQQWWLKRMIETPRPLEEKMTLFWHGHFATSYRTIENSYHMYMQNQLFREHAVGNYGDLMFRIIRDPAMLAYLDNNDSSARRPNENLARELMELFSLGEGNYTEKDIKEGARALTGYSFDDDSFVFHEDRHDKGQKRILGKRGTLDGDGFVTAILEDRATSSFIAAKLYDFFSLHLNAPASDGDSAEARATNAVVDDMGRELLRSRYEVAPVLKKLFMSEHFYHPRVMNNRIKSPAELVVGAVRSLLTPVRDMGVLIQAMDLMGQHVFMPPSVKGWDGGRSWVNTSTLFVRQNMMNFLLTGRLPHGYDATAKQEPYDPVPLLSPLIEASPASARQADAVIDYLLRFTIGGSPEHARIALEDFANNQRRADDTNLITGMLVLITAMPEYQLC
ncbi:MAG: DUF1800 domain-containing protein [Planctomycetota bacterium]